MTTITYQAMPPETPVTRADRVVRLIIPVFAVIGLVLLFGFYLPEAEDRRILAAIVFLLGFPLLAGGLQLAEWSAAKTAPPASSSLLLDDEGLTWRHTRWPWRELSAFELCDLGPKRRFIWFHVPEDSQASAPYRRRIRVGPGRSERRITGRFDAPLADIAARLNDVRRRALGDAAEGGAAERLPAAGPDGTARVFFADAERIRTAALLDIVFFLVVIIALSLPDLPRWVFVLYGLLFGVVLIGALAGLCYSLASSYRLAPADNFLALDGNGLTVMHRGRATNWAWREIAPFLVRAAGPVGRALRCSYLSATVPDDRRLSRLWRWIGRLLLGGPALVLPDIYLGRLEKIAATLNRHRERALGCRADTAGPQAPAPA